MKISKKVIIIAIVVFILSMTLGVVNVFNRSNREEENLDQNNIHTNIDEKVDEYEIVESIDESYTIDNAINNKAFVIDKGNKLYNETVLSDFMNEISNSGDAHLRIVNETVDSLLSVLDIQCSGDEITVTQNNMQLSGDSIQNKYLKSNGYAISNELVILGDGTKLKSYYLKKNDLEEKIDLFAYQIMDFEEMPNSGELSE